MKRLILQQNAPLYDAQCGGPLTYHELGRHLDRAVASTTEFRDSGKFHVALLQMPTFELCVQGKISGLGYEFEEARDWVDVISGNGKGCWADNLIEP